MPKPRKDRLQSRALIVAAAADLLAENADASFAEIGVRAGLNQATVYRHFPERAELFAAVMERTIERFEEMVGGWDLGPGSFEELLRQMAAQQASYRGLMLRIRFGQPIMERREAVRARTVELFSEPLVLAKGDGRVKASFEPTDVFLILHMVEGAVAGSGEKTVAAADEALDLILAGLRP
jgi:AcrR family transcriptional regulator